MKLSCCCLSLVLASGSAWDCLAAQRSTHLVPATELRSALTAQAVERERHIAEVRTLLAHQQIRQRVSRLADPVLVEQAVANLNDAMLRDLGEKSRRINQDIAAAGATKWIVIAAVAVAAVVITVVLVERFVINE